jgi:peptidoglycan hydrolase-like protein with peptidoglycan-binding domain
MSGTLSPWPVVQNGKQGHPVRTQQCLLRAHGHNLTVDGRFGPGTEAAVKAFQTSKGMTADGIINLQTWSALIIQVKKGGSGDAVRGVQEEFQFRAGEPGQGLKVDGIFGPQTGTVPYEDFNTLCSSKVSTSLAKSARERVSRSTL